MAKKMLLALSVISHQSRRLGASSYRVFDEHGGTIGRGKNNDWVLDDPTCQLSSRHVSVHASDDCFVIEDISSNGTGLNTREALLPRGQRVPIVDGDRLFLADFEILVQVVEHVAAAPAAGRAADATVFEDAALRPTQLSSILTIVTWGLIDLQRARVQLEDQFRIKRAAGANGPLNASDPPAAFSQAFEELLRHASGVLAGIQAAHIPQQHRDAFVRAYDARLRELEDATIFDAQ